jgi:Armadillo/beta-catenin-like repeat-containing protein
LSDKACSRRLVRQLLAADDFEAALQKFSRMPAQRLLKHLQARLPSANPKIKWRAVMALGQTVRDLAARDLEAARDFARRLLWALNEESGAVPWGCAEALGEIMASDQRLAREYACLLLSLITKGCNFLEFEALQGGVAWGLGRLAQEQPKLLREMGAMPPLLELMDSPDPQVRGMCAWTLGHLGGEEAKEKLKLMTGQTDVVLLGQAGDEIQTTVGQLASIALQLI